MDSENQESNINEHDGSEPSELHESPDEPTVTNKELPNEHEDYSPNNITTEARADIDFEEKQIESTTKQHDKPAQPVDAKPTESHNPGLIVLQWLTYAFWGLTAIALSVLTGLVLTATLVKNSDVGDAPVYSLAAVLVLLPLSVVCDFFYSKHEPEKKTGAASVVMVIHAVLFALYGIGSLITVVFSLVTLFVSASDNSSTLVVLYNSLIMTFLSICLFLRTLIPKRIFKYRRIFMLLMVAIATIICLFGIAGPIMEARSLRNDKLIENNLSSITDKLSDYAEKNNRLPDSLSELTLSGDAKALVTNNLVAYHKDSSPSGTSLDAYYYQLCVTYKKEKISDYDHYDSSSYDGYSTRVSTYAHPAGNKCYKVKTYEHNTYPVPTDSSTESNSST